MTDATTVLIVAEVGDDGIRPATYELVTAGLQVGQGLGAQVVALLLGSGVGGSAEDLARTGVARVLVADDERLASFVSGAWTTVVARSIEEVKPAVVLMPGTTSGRDYAPRVAARLDLGLAADCVDLQVEEGGLVAVRPVLGGRLQTAVRFEGAGPALATVRPGSFDLTRPSNEAVAVTNLPVELGPDDLKVRVIETLHEETGGKKLDGAERIVAGGRGLKEPDQFVLVEELASALNAAVGASRAVVDAGWRPHHEQVGQTGQTVAPRLYVAVGISGAVQHLVGMQSAEYVVAINRDPDAPIFKIASFGIVGDLFEVVPAVIEEIKAARA